MVVKYSASSNCSDPLSLDPSGRCSNGVRDPACDVRHSLLLFQSSCNHPVNHKRFCIGCRRSAKVANGDRVGVIGFHVATTTPAFVADTPRISPSGSSTILAAQVSHGLSINVTPQPFRHLFHRAAAYVGADVWLGASCSQGRGTHGCRSCCLLLLPNGVGHLGPLITWSDAVHQWYCLTKQPPAMQVGIWIFSTHPPHRCGCLGCWVWRNVPTQYPP